MVARPNTRTKNSGVTLRRGEKAPDYATEGGKYWTIRDTPETQNAFLLVAQKKLRGEMGEMGDMAPMLQPRMTGDREHPR